MRIRPELCISIVAMLLMSASVNAQDVWDTDGDGYDDNNDNCTLTWNAAQRDTDGDFMGNMCDADFNSDDVINNLDLGYMRDNFLTSDPHADLDGDGFVGFQDLDQMKVLFLDSPGPTGTDPNQPPCTCYFSGDCPSGQFCDYGPGSFATEDICVWRDIKPNGNVGTGCSIESDLTTGAWTPDICDGVCSGSSRGSSIGLEDTGLVAQTVSIWGEAMINPSAAGGGPVDPELAAQATAIQFNGANVPIMLGRHAADALAMASGEPFHDYFCHYEGHPEDPDQPIVDLAGNTCRIVAGQLTIQALASELQTPGTAAEIMQGIPEVCPSWQKMFTTQCKVGPDALNCAIRFIETQAEFLSTPPSSPSARPDPLEALLGNIAR
ncbi:MAG: hypothetical protein OEQ74_08440 [Gammaproteobacteria bacterium]|nr:hypothetical protein [Gammaproteobacteria bacterium]